MNTSTFNLTNEPLSQLNLLQGITENITWIEDFENLFAGVDKGTAHKWNYFRASAY